MATMREIRTRIRTVKNIEKITRAMKLVAAARLRRATERVKSARPYAELMQHMMAELARAGQDVSHPLLEVRPERNIGVILITSDRGLCGSYNTNLIRKTMELLRPRDPETVKLVLMGRKGQGFFRRQRYPVVASMSITATEVSFSDVAPLVSALRQMFETEQVDAVYVVYSKFVSAMTQAPTVLQLLPLAPPSVEGEERAEEAPQDMIFEPSAPELLAHLLPRYVDTQVYRALTEAIASEHGARMTSMSAATSNAGEMIDSLTLSLNRARQAAITREIAEIVGGAEAVK
jgi:F-type H+-transporting ATPase subunit gamma